MFRINVWRAMGVLIALTGTVDASAEPRGRVLFCVDSEAHATLLSRPDLDARIYSVEGVDAQAVDSLIQHLNNERLFASALEIAFVGDIPPWVVDRVTSGVGDRASSIEVASSPIDVLDLDSSVELVWFDQPEGPIAVFWADRKRRVTGRNFVLLSDMADVEALLGRGLLSSNVTDFGGSFLHDLQVHDWKGKEVPQFAIRELVTPQDVNREAVRVFREFQAFQERNAGVDCLAPTCPNPPANADVVLFTGYPEGQSGTEPGPLSYYNSNCVVQQYVTDTCGLGLCRPNACPQRVAFKTSGIFMSRCGADFDPTKTGWDCVFDTSDAATEDNYLDESIKDVVDNQIFDVNLAGSTIDNVVIIAHWMDIPYRQKLFPYVPSSECGTPQGPCEVTPGGELTDADFLSTDADNDYNPGIDGCSGPGFQQSRVFGSKPGSSQETHCVPGQQTCAHDGYPDDCDPDPFDDGWDGETGQFDFFLAHYRPDPSGHKYAQAGFGRIAAHTVLEAQELVTHASAFLESPATPPPGATAVIGGTMNNLEGPAYRKFEALATCRYGAGGVRATLPRPFLPQRRAQLVHPVAALRPAERSAPVECGPGQRRGRAGSGAPEL